MPTVSVIIPTMPGREAMLEKLISTIPSAWEIIIVKDMDILLAAKRNKGARQANGEYLLFIDDDNYLNNNGIKGMAQTVSQGIGIMGMMALYHDKKRRIADGGSKRNYITGFMRGLRTNQIWPGADADCYEVDEVANAFMMRKEVFDEVGGFDEENFPIDLDEADICKRIKDCGYRIIMNPMAVCYHSSQTYSPIPDFRRPMNAYFMGRNKILYQKKHLNKFKFLIYFIFFLPIFLFGYTACLLYRGKPNMVLHYWKGTLDGLTDRKENPYQQRKSS